MFKYATTFVLAGAFALGVPPNPDSTTGSWQVDAQHSDAHLVTDGTTDYGKTKINVALGVARVNGKMTLDVDPSKSNIEFRMYPATSMAPVIAEDGKFLDRWLADQANHTLICFHSKEVTRKPDGRLQVTGTLVLTRVDRNVDASPTEAYSGPVYGPPMLHRVSRDATFVFDAPATDKDGELVATGTTNMVREDFPQLVKTVTSTYWPPVVQDEKCEGPVGNGQQDYSGFHCTGTFVKTPALPAAPHALSGQDVGTQTDFNSVTGNHLTILVHLRLSPRNSGEVSAAGGN